MARKAKGKKKGPSGRPDVAATHGRDRLAPPPKSATPPPQRMPGRGFR